MIKIIKIDINEYIKRLADSGESAENIVLALYDGRVNGLDTIEKCKQAVAEYENNLKNNRKNKLK